MEEIKLTMDVDVALKRLKWLVQKKGHADDVEAFNNVLLWIQSHRQKNYKVFSIVAKLFTWIFVSKARYTRDSEGKIPNAAHVLRSIKEIVKSPMEWHYEDLMFNVPIIRFEMLYKDYDEKIREQQRIMEANKIPQDKFFDSKENEKYGTEYQDKDIEQMIHVKRLTQDEIDADFNRMVDAFITPYTRQEAEHFVIKNTTELLDISEVADLAESKGEHYNQEEVNKFKKLGEELMRYGYANTTQSRS